MPTNQELTAHVGDWIETRGVHGRVRDIAPRPTGGEKAGIPQLHISPLCRRGHSTGRH
jgi:hypothetical protein